MEPSSFVPSDAQSRIALARILEEFVRRVEMGDRVNLESEVALHPEHADELRRLWPSIKILVSLGNDHSKDGQSQFASSFAPMEAPRDLGEFRIVRELGRGGMGVVYEAEQRSLVRRVAIKVLPFASVLDPRQLARFQNEARAAACLHHAHIVPVFSVGCERGVHYFAMQLIEGHSLAVMLAAESPRDSLPPRLGADEGRDSAPPKALQDTDPMLQSQIDTWRSRSILEQSRAIAEWGVNIADALQHAHDEGIVHRDIKPSNLLVDERGKVWLTDFGLARLGTESGVTMSGDLLGTLRYMSPEQASGDLHRVDHRTDIYSLGATLYELATRCPIFAARDREQLLKSVLHEEPIAPRRHCRELPADFETIVLKAIQKDKTWRYATARDLANDLRRFLDNRVITAKRPTLVQLSRKWFARHRVLINSIVATLLLATLVSGFMLWREQRRTAAAYAQEKEERVRAEGNLNLALEAMDQLYLQFVGNTLSEETGLTKLQRQFLQRAVVFYDRFAVENQRDVRQWPQLAHAHLQLARIHQRLGELKSARSAFQRASTDYRTLISQQSHDRTLALDGATCLQEYASFMLSLGKPREAESLLLQAIKETQRLEKVTPNDVAIRESRADQLSELAAVYGATGRKSESVKASSDSLSIREELATRRPHEKSVVVNLGRCLHNQAIKYVEDRQFNEAKTLYTRAIELQRQVIEKHPGDPTPRRMLCDHLRGLARVAGQLGERSLAEQSYTEAHSLAQQLMRDDADQPDFQAELAAILFEWAADLNENGQVMAAREKYGQVDDLLGTLVNRFETLPDYLKLLALSSYNQGTMLSVAGKYDDAAKGLARAELLLCKLVKSHPELTEMRRPLAMCQYNLAYTLLELERNPEAEAMWQKSLATWQELMRQFPKDSEITSRVGAVLSNLAIHARDRNDFEQSILLSRQAIEHQQRACSLFPTYPQCESFLKQHYDVLAETQRQTGVGNSNPRLPMKNPKKNQSRASVRRATEFCCESLERRSMMAVDWAFALQGNIEGSTPYGYDVSIGPSDDVYILSSFSGTVDLDPSEKSVVLSATRNNTDAGDGVIARYSSSGELRWAKRFGGAGREYTRGIVVDSDGNAYITGISYADSPADFGAITIPAGSPSYDLFVAKIDPQGEFLWAHRIGGEQSEGTESLVLGPDNSLVMAASFFDTVDFDPGPEVHERTSLGGSDGVIWRLDTDGRFVSAIHVGGPGNEGMHSIALDALGNMYVAGAFQGTVEFGGAAGSLTAPAPNIYNGFMVKYDASVQPVWVRHAKSDTETLNQRLVANAEGDLYWSTGFRDSLEFDRGAPKFASRGATDAVVTRWTSQGDFVWSQQLGGSEDVFIRTQRLAPNGYLWLAGRFSGRIEFGTKTLGGQLHSVGETDGFWLTFDESGSFVSAQQAGGILEDRGYGIAFDSHETAYLSGSFHKQITLSDGSTLNAASLYNDFFLVKLLPTLPGDFDADGELTTRDLDTLGQAINRGTYETRFDVNRDGLLDGGDRRFWVHDLKRTFFGDANLDGQFDSRDLVLVFALGNYEDGVTANSGWAEGDWNGDGEFDSSDFVVAFQDNGYERKLTL